MGSPLIPALTQLSAILLVASEAEGGGCWLQSGKLGGGEAESPGEISPD